MSRVQGLISQTLSRVDRLVNAILKEYSQADYGNFTIKESGDYIDVSAHFCKLPFKHDSKKSAKTLCVFINGRLKLETYKSSMRIENYSTELSYLTIEDFSAPYTSLKPLTGFHFDYEAKKENHPVFHAQHKRDVYLRALTDNKIFSCAAEYVPDISHGTVRIPTSQMDPLSVLVMIVADHLAPQESEGRFRKFLDDIKQLIIPMCSDKSIAEISTCGVSPEIYKWYPAPPKPVKI